MVSVMTILDHIRNQSPKALALFVIRAQAQTGEDSACPFFQAGALGRLFGDRDAAVALFRAACDAGTSRARRKTGWQL